VQHYMMRSKHDLCVILLCLLVVLSLCALTRSSYATDGSLNPYVYVAPLLYVAEEAGELFHIALNISNVNNLHSVEFKLSYNASLLDALQVIQASFLPYPPQSFVRLEINKSTGFVWMNISSVHSEPGRSGDGTLARIAFNVTLGAKCSYSVLHLQETSLHDDSMAAINHNSFDGLYFWKSAHNDPPAQGGLLDLFTQKGGTGCGEPDGFFLLGEMVELHSYVTYNNWPKQQKQVAFQVIEPIGSTVLIVANTTDQNGIADISFRIPMLPDSYGLWTAVSTCDVAGETIGDIVQFWCVVVPI